MVTKHYFNQRNLHVLLGYRGPTVAPHLAAYSGGRAVYLSGNLMQARVLRQAHPDCDSFLEVEFMV